MDTLKDKRILVTGGCGYVGNLLVKKLHELNAKVFIFDIASPSGQIHDVVYYNVSLLNDDLLYKLTNQIKPQKIYHLAASLNRTRDYNTIDKILDINLKGTNNLLRALKEIDYSSFIFTSTSEVYGNQTKIPFKEDLAMQPTSPYSLSKAAAELSIQTFSNIYNQPFTILRLFNIYGPNLPESFFIPQLINALKENKNFDMTKGEQKRDFVFIDNIIEVLINVATNQNANNQIFNVCSGESTSMRELALEIKKFIPSQAKINFGAIPYRKNEIWDMVGNATKIKYTLSLNIKIGLYEGLKRLFYD